MYSGNRFGTLAGGLSSKIGNSREMCLAVHRQGGQT